MALWITALPVVTRPHCRVVADTARSRLQQPGVSPSATGSWQNVAELLPVHTAGSGRQTMQQCQLLQLGAWCTAMQPELPRSSGLHRASQNPSCRSSDDAAVPAGQVMVCTATRPEWPVLHASASCHALLTAAEPAAKILNMSLWELFGHPGKPATLGQHVRDVPGRLASRQAVQQPQH